MVLALASQLKLALQTKGWWADAVFIKAQRCCVTLR